MPLTDPSPNGWLAHGQQAAFGWCACQLADSDILRKLRHFLFPKCKGPASRRATGGA